MTIRNAFSELSTEDTLAALKAVADNILAASANIEAAVGAINAKTTEVDTSELATDATAAAIRDMTDTIVTALQGIQSRMGLINRNGALTVVPELQSGTFGTYPSQYYSNHMSAVCRSPTGDLSNLTVTLRSHEPFQFSNMGALHLYDKISVS